MRIINPSLTAESSDSEKFAAFAEGVMTGKVSILSLPSDVSWQLQVKKLVKLKSNLIPYFIGSGRAGEFLVSFPVTFITVTSAATLKL